MSFLQNLKRRFSSPRLTDPDFGPLRFMYISNAPERSYWEAESWPFHPTGTLVGVGLRGPETGPLPEAREFYLRLPERFPAILEAVRPALDRVSREWLGHPLATDLWTDFKLTGFDVDDPRITPVEWSVAFEATGETWLGITVPFVGDQARDPVVDT